MMESKFFQTDLGTIRYWVSRMQPQMPWLVFLPGLTADHTLFEKQLAHFSSRYNCFVWDAPAHGLSRPFQLSFTMWDLAYYLHEIFEAEGIVSPVLIGQSLGGYISQVYMDKYPGAVSGFVSIDSCPMSRKYYSSWELALLKKTKGMYMSILWKLLQRPQRSFPGKHGCALFPGIWIISGPADGSATPPIWAPRSCP